MANVVDDAARYMAAKRVSSELDPEASGRTKPGLTPIGELEGIIATTSVAGVQPIHDDWEEVTGEPMSDRSDFIVRTEMVWFLLHMVARYAFKIGGPQARATIQDAIGASVVTSVVTFSFDTSDVQEGIDVEQMHRQMIGSCMTELNEAEAEYSSCKEVYGASTVPTTEGIIGRLASRIATSTGQEDNVVLRLLIGKTAVEALYKSGLDAAVAKACGVVDSQ